jgi:hypothetical protein
MNVCFQSEDGSTAIVEVKKGDDGIMKMFGKLVMLQGGKFEIRNCGNTCHVLVMTGDKKDL